MVVRGAARRHVAVQPYDECARRGGVPVTAHDRAVLVAGDAGLEVLAFTGRGARMGRSKNEEQGCGEQAEHDDRRV